VLHAQREVAQDNEFNNSHRRLHRAMAVVHGPSGECFPGLFRQSVEQVLTPCNKAAVCYLYVCTCMQSPVTRRCLDQGLTHLALLSECYLREGLHKRSTP
jgi:hypothetical protein